MIEQHHTENRALYENNFAHPTPEMIVHQWDFRLDGLAG
jgi:hypothetical protein